jgi:hypothetical protein
MNILIDFEPIKADCNFEGTRLRKTLKGCLELAGEKWVPSLLGSPSIVHLLSPNSEAKAHDAAEERLKVVVSALYCENDPSTRFLEKSLRTGEPVIKKSARRLFEYADLILVPNEDSKDFLVKNYVKQRIEVLPSGVNLTRFEKNDPLEETFFSRYVSLKENEKYIISVGDYEDNDTIEAINTIASFVPDVKFFFLGLSKRGRTSSSFRKHLSKNSPSNMFYLDLLEDDVYRSALKGALGYISFGCVHPDNIEVFEANAAHAQVFSLGPKIIDDSVIDKVNGYTYSSVEKLAKGIQSYCLGKLNSTIIGGYRTAKSVSLPIIGKKLQSLYLGLEEGEIK